MGYTASIDENDDTIINIISEEDSNDPNLNIGNCLMTIIDKIIESKKYNLNVYDNGRLTTILYYSEIVEENVEKFNNIQIDQIIFNILNTEKEKLSLLNDITKEKIKKFNIKINIIPPSKSPEDPEAYEIKVRDIEDNKETENTKFNIAISQYSIIKLSLKLDLNLYISISDGNTKDYYKSNKEYTNDFIEIDYEYENKKLIKYYNIDYPLDKFITEAKTEEGKDLINNNVYSISDKVKSVVYKNKENDDVMMNFYNMINNTEQIKLEIPNIENGIMKNFDLISNVKLDIKRKASINNISYTIYEDTSETISADTDNIPKSSYKKIHLTEKAPINLKYSNAISKNQKLKNSINKSISNVKLKQKKSFFVKGKQIIKTKDIRGKIKIKGLTNIINDEEEFILNIENDESGEPEYDDTFVTKTNANIKVISETSEEIILKFEEKENERDDENKIQINKLSIDSKSNVNLSFPETLTEGEPDIGTVELLGESTISFENLKKTVKPVTLLIPYGKDISDVIVGDIPSTLEIIKENAPQTTDEQLKEMENKIDELTDKINNLNSKLNKALAVLILTNDKLF